MKKNTKIIRLTENDLERMVRRIIKESDDYETSTPIKPVTIHGKTYKFVEDLPIRELGIGSYVIQDGIVMVDGDTPLQDWLTQDMDAEDYMDDELEWAKDSLQAKEGFDWLLHEPLDNLVGLRFDWDGNLYEVTAAFEDEDEGGIWLNALDPETGEDYDDSIPLDALVADLEDGIASFID